MYHDVAPLDVFFKLLEHGILYKKQATKPPPRVLIDLISHRGRIKALIITITCALHAIFLLLTEQRR